MNLDEQIARARKELAVVKKERRIAQEKQRSLRKTHRADRYWLQNRTQQQFYTSKRLRMDVYYDVKDRPPMRVTNKQSLLLGLSIRARAESNLAKVTDSITSRLTESMVCEHTAVAREKQAIILDYEAKKTAVRQLTSVLEKRYKMQLQAQRLVISSLRLCDQKLSDLLEKDESLRTVSTSDDSSSGSSGRDEMLGSYRDSYASMIFAGFSSSVSHFGDNLLNYSQHGR